MMNFEFNLFENISSIPYFLLTSNDTSPTNNSISSAKQQPDDKTISTFKINSFYQKHIDINEKEERDSFLYFNPSVHKNSSIYLKTEHDESPHYQGIYSTNPKVVELIDHNQEVMQNFKEMIKKKTHSD